VACFAKKYIRKLAGDQDHIITEKSNNPYLLVGGWTVTFFCILKRGDGSSASFVLRNERSNRTVPLLPLFFY
ncbi:MAG: hypothetical protein ACK4M9_20620, partial [Anaerobacillus sp.]|uniref:hypothetical protein n=1 Tax=Anaerobacillus sp. TaxID=1872506 RepID=UPI00391DEB64